MPAKITSAFTLVIVGVIIADILINPVGTQAAANGLAEILKLSYSALLGIAPN